VLPVVGQIEASGVKGYRALAEALNARGIRTAQGGEWRVARDDGAEFGGALSRWREFAFNSTRDVTTARFSKFYVAEGAE
jgi:hypothetical protein